MENCNKCLMLKEDDCATIFQDVISVLDFAQSFSEALQAAALTSSATSSRSPTTSEIFNDGTTIGQTFMDHMVRLERVYTSFCIHQEQSSAKLRKMQEDPVIEGWFAERKIEVTTRTHAWDLPSLLIKPVQRILKYPLFLKEMINATECSHGDFHSLEEAFMEMSRVVDRIDRLAGRRDISTSTHQRRKSDHDVKYGIGRQFGKSNGKQK